MEAGRLVHRGEEIDHVVIDHERREVLAVEAKWSTLSPLEAEKTARRLLGRLQAALPGKAQRLPGEGSGLRSKAPRRAGRPTRSSIPCSRRRAVGQRLLALPCSLITLLY